MTRASCRVEMRLLLTAAVLVLAPVYPQPLLLPASSRSSADVLITALAFHGYEGNADEAVQLTNVSNSPVTLDGRWLLEDANGNRWRFITHTLPPGGRMWIANSAPAFARQFGFSPTLTYTGLIFANNGGAVSLGWESPEMRDTANGDGGGWPAGTASPSYCAMERIDASAPDADVNWATATLTNAATNRDGQPVCGTPRAPNSAAITPATNTTLTVVINEVAWSGTSSSRSGDEWIELRNLTDQPVALDGWRLQVNSNTHALSGVIAPQGHFLIQRNANTFSSGAAADLTLNFTQLSNNGARLALIDTRARVVDALVYGNAAPRPGWSGAPLQPYTVTLTIPQAGQVLMRRLDLRTALPISDTDTAQDWLNDRDDPIDARKPIYPGWRLEDFLTPVSDTGAITIAIAPDASYSLTHDALRGAVTSIDLASFTFEQARLGELLADKAAQGVRVRVLLDGAPVGGLKDQTRWICRQITLADTSGQSGCWFMRADASQNIYARYAFLHAKFAILDGARLLLGSENFGPRGMPDDDKQDGTAGQRGVVLMTDAPTLVARAQAIFDADISSAHRDIVRWCPTCAPYGNPPSDFTPDYTTGGISYTARFTQPLAITAAVPVTLFTSPENHLVSSAGLIPLLNAAGAGDEILVQQLNEPPYWGPTISNPETDPNPRLQALIGAAARGARVRVLLDQHYDDPNATRSNASTVAMLNSLARANGWDLRAARGNPTGLGIHNKMFLMRVGGRSFAFIGSWNGSETSTKRNREMSALVESEEAWAFLREMFLRDFQWAHPSFLPSVLFRYPTVRPLLISEVMINPRGGDELGREWIEIYNPNPHAVSLAGYKIGDAVTPTNVPGEGMFAFPPTATIPAHGVIVIAQNAASFFSDWGIRPHYELSDYDPLVPELTPYAAWATGMISLANAGDEVLLLDAQDRISDGAAWLSGTVPEVISWSGAITAGESLQRWPPDADTDDCNADFRGQSLPSPGQVP